MESKRTLLTALGGLLLAWSAGCHEPSQKMDIRPNNQGGVNITPLREQDYPPDIVATPAPPPPPPAPVAAGPTAEERAAASEAKAAASEAKAAAEAKAAPDAAKAAEMQRHIDSLETQVKQMNAEIERLKAEKAAGATTRP